MGFIGYRREREPDSGEIVRIYLECAEDRTPASTGAGTGAVACTFIVDAIFPGGDAPCQLRGVDSVLALKKFYKLVFSLEERAREHGNDWRAVMQSAEGLLEHLRYTRNARDFTAAAEPAVAGSSEAVEDLDCLKIGEGA